MQRNYSKRILMDLLAFLNCMQTINLSFNMENEANVILIFV